MEKTIFSKQTVILLLAFGFILFGISVILDQKNLDSDLNSQKNDYSSTYSNSAIGFAGYYNLLQSLGYNVTRNRGNIYENLSYNSILVLLAPNLKYLYEENGIDASLVLLVLPKWEGRDNGAKRGWISGLELLSEHYVEEVFEANMNKKVEVVRNSWPSGWKTNLVGDDPYGNGSVQLIKSVDIRPIVGNPEGILIGEMKLKDQVILIISDPDILSNHGIYNIINAQFMLNFTDVLIQMSGNDNIPLVFDETIHGYGLFGRSIFSIAFSFPFNIVIILSVLSSFMLVFAGSERFGAPISCNSPLSLGKQTLINNSARLLNSNGYYSDSALKYIRMTIRLVAESFRIRETDFSLVRSIDLIGIERGVKLSCGDILNRALSVDSKSDEGIMILFDCVREIHKWKLEMLYESSFDK